MIAATSTQQAPTSAPKSSKADRNSSSSNSSINQLSTINGCSNLNESIEDISDTSRHILNSKLLPFNEYSIDNNPHSNLKKQKTTSKDNRTFYNNGVGGRMMNGNDSNAKHILSNMNDSSRVLKSSNSVQMGLKSSFHDTNTLSKSKNNTVSHLISKNKKFFIMPLNHKLQNPQIFIKNNNNSDNLILNMSTPNKSRFQIVNSRALSSKNSNVLTSNNNDRNKFVNIKSSSHSLPSLINGNNYNTNLVQLNSSKDLKNKFEFNQLTSPIKNQNYDQVQIKSVFHNKKENNEIMKMPTAIAHNHQTSSIQDNPQVEIYTLKSKISAIKIIFKKLKLKFGKILEDEFQLGKQNILKLHSNSKNEKIILKKSILHRKLKRFDILKLMNQKMLRKLYQVNYKEFSSIFMMSHLNTLNYIYWPYSTYLQYQSFFDTLKHNSFYNTFIYALNYSEINNKLNADLNNYKKKCIFLDNFVIDLTYDEISQDILTLSSASSLPSVIIPSNFKPKNQIYDQININRNSLTYSNHCPIPNIKKNKETNFMSSFLDLTNKTSQKNLNITHLNESIIPSQLSSSVIFSTEIKGKIFSKGDEVFVLKQNHPMLSGRILSISESKLLIKGPSGRLKLDIEDLKSGNTIDLVHKDDSLDT